MDNDSNNPGANSEKNTSGLFSRLLKRSPKESGDIDKASHVPRDLEYEHMQQVLSDSLSHQLEELKEAQEATRNYQSRLSGLLDGAESGQVSSPLESGISQAQDAGLAHELTHFKEELQSLMNVVNLQFEEQKQLEEVYRNQRDTLATIESQYQQLVEQNEITEADNQERDSWVRNAEKVLTANSNLNNAVLEDINQLKAQLIEQTGGFQEADARLKTLTVSMRDQDQQLAELQVTVEQLLENVQGLKQKEGAKRDVLAEAETAQIQVKTILESCHKSLEEQRLTNDRISARSDEVQTLAERMGLQFGVVQELAEEVANKEEAVASEVSRFKTELARFQEEKANLESELQSQQRGMKQHTQLVKQKLAVVDNKIDQIESIKQESDHVLTLAQNARKVAHRFNDDVADKLAEVTRMHASVEKIAERTETLSQEYGDFKRKMQAFSEALDHDKQAEQRLLADLDKYRASFKDHHQSWGSFKKWCRELSEGLLAAEKQLKDEKSSCEDLLTRTEKLIEKVHTDQDSVDVQKEVVQKALGHVKHLFTKVNGLIEDHNQGQKSLTELMDNERALSSGLEKQTAEVQRICAEVEDKLQQFERMSAQAEESQQQVESLIDSCQSWEASAKDYTAHNKRQIAKMDEALSYINGLQTDFDAMSDQFVQMHSKNQSLQQQLSSDSEQLMKTEQKVNESCQVVLSLIDKNKVQADQLSGNLVSLRSLRDNTESEFQKIREYSLEMATVVENNEALERRLADMVDEHQTSMQGYDDAFQRYQKWIQELSNQGQALVDRHQILLDESSQQVATVTQQAQQIRAWHQTCETISVQQQRDHEEIQSIIETVREDAIWYKKSFAECETLHEEAFECFNKSIELKTELQQILAVMADTASTVDHKASDSNVLFAQAKTLIEDQKNLEQTVEAKVQQLEHLRQTCSNALEQARVLNGQADVSREAIEEGREEILRLSDHTQGVLTDVEQRLQEVEALGKTVTSAYERLQQAEARTQSLVESVQSANQSAQSCIQDVYGVKHEAESLLGSVTDLLNKGGEQQKQVKEAIDHNAELAVRLDNTCENIAAQLDRIDILEEGFNAALGRESEHLLAHEKVNLEEKQQLENAITEYTQYRDNLDQVLKQWATTAEQYQELRSDCQTSLAKSEELHTKVANLYQLGQQTLGDNRGLKGRLEEACSDLENRFAHYENIASEFDALKAQSGAQITEVSQQKALTEQLSEQVSKSLEQQKSLYLQCTEMQTSMVEQHQQVIDERVRVEASGEHYLKSLRTQHQPDETRLLSIEQQIKALQSRQEQAEKSAAAAQNASTFSAAEIAPLHDKMQGFEAALATISDKFQTLWSEVQDQGSLTSEVAESNRLNHSALNDLISEFKGLKNEFHVFKASPTGYVGPKYGLQRHLGLEREAPVAESEPVAEPVPAVPVSAPVPGQAPAQPSPNAVLDSLDQSQPKAQIQPDTLPQPKSQAEPESQPEARPVSGVLPEAAEESALAAALNELEASFKRQEQLDALQGKVSDVVDQFDQNKPAATRRGDQLKNLLFSLVACVGLGLITHISELNRSESGVEVSLSGLITEESSAIGNSAISNPKTPLRWPLAGVQQVAEIEYGRYRNGLYLPTALGAAIRAIDDGQVVFSGHAGMGVGQVVILQHAGELLSVYGNNHENFVGVGDAVHSGQVIASVGEAFTEVPSLYFELRYQGHPEDPFLYFNQQVG